MKTEIKIEDIQPKFEEVERTNAALYEQNIQYNQTGLTYNDPATAYGGVYNPNT